MDPDTGAGLFLLKYRGVAGWCEYRLWIMTWIARPYHQCGKLQNTCARRYLDVPASSRDKLKRRPGVAVIPTLTHYGSISDGGISPFGLPDTAPTLSCVVHFHTCHHQRFVGSTRGHKFKPRTARHRVSNTVAPIVLVQMSIRVFLGP